MNSYCPTGIDIIAHGQRVRERHHGWRMLLFPYTQGGTRRLVYTELAEVLTLGYNIYGFQPKEKKIGSYCTHQ